MSNRESLLLQVRENPTNWEIRRLLADLLYDEGDVSGSHLEQARAFCWAWAVMHKDLRLCDVSGRGNAVKVAAFTRGDEFEWGDSPPGADQAVLVWIAEDYDVPGDRGRGGERSLAQDGITPWLVSGRNRNSETPLPSVWHGASLIDFCRAVENANGWWWPVG